MNRFERAFNALTTAYFEGTLAKGTCHACAVGNIVGSSIGAKICQFISDKNNYYWSDLFITVGGTNYQHRYFNEEASKRLYDDTGYTADELALVENAFETSTKLHWIDDYPNKSEQSILEDQYNGLAAVIDVLCQLDGITTVIEHKAEFRKHPRLAAV